MENKVCNKSMENSFFVTSVKKEIFANPSFEETRIAILEDGRLAELFWERRSNTNIVGNIYKAVVENVLPGISSAFMNIALPLLATSIPTLTYP